MEWQPLWKEFTGKDYDDTPNKIMNVEDGIRKYAEIIAFWNWEKVKEVLPEEEIRNAVDMGDYYVIQPNHHWWNMSEFKEMIEAKGKPISSVKEYASGTNTEWLNQSQLADLISKT